MKTKEEITKELDEVILSQVKSPDGWHFQQLADDLYEIVKRAHE